MSRPAGRPRVLVGCLFQESGSFAPGRATWRAFEAAGVLEGAELRRDRLPGARELAAAWDRIEAAGMTVVPSLFAWAPPGPIVEQAAWERLAEAMAALPNVVPYLDMPLQHGSDAVLRRMKRPTLAKSRRSIEVIRRAIPDVTLRSTFIVGFPGETETEFRELLRFVEQERLDHVGAFTYSPQIGTPAAAYGDQVPEPVKQERYGRLMELAQRISHESNRAMVGREVDVLVESREPGTSQSGEPIVIGRTVRDAPEVDGLALVKGTYPMGTMVRVRVDGALPYDLLCTPVEVAARP